VRKAVPVRFRMVGPVQAHAVSDFVASSKLGVDHHGRFIDDYELAGGTWLISRRQVVVDSAALTSVETSLDNVRTRRRWTDEVPRPRIAGG